LCYKPPNKAMIGAKLKNHWLSLGVKVNAGVSHDELDAFESKYQVVLPADLRDYFLTVDGMVEGVMDHGCFSFWSLNAVKPIPDESPNYSDPYIKDARSFFVFADFLIWSHAYAIRLAATDAANTIFMIGGETPIKMYDSFSEFVSAYLSDPDRLL
jgi:hypothetical protein